MAEFLSAYAIWPEPKDGKYLPLVFNGVEKRVNLNPYHVKSVDNPAILKTRASEIDGYVVMEQTDQLKYFVPNK